MGALNWIKEKWFVSRFDRAFSVLKELGETNAGAKRTYELLSKLRADTPREQVHGLIDAVHEIRFASNANTVFFFYFSIVSHILYYQPEFAEDLLGYLIGPAFANGTTETEELIALIHRSMNFKLSEDKHFMTKEGQAWVTDQLPKMEEDVEREVQRCWAALEG